MYVITNSNRNNFNEVILFYVQCRRILKIKKVLILNKDKYYFPHMAYLFRRQQSSVATITVLSTQSNEHQRPHNVREI